MTMIVMLIWLSFLEDYPWSINYKISAPKCLKLRKQKYRIWSYFTLAFYQRKCQDNNFPKYL